MTELMLNILGVVTIYAVMLVYIFIIIKIAIFFAKRNDK